MDPLFAGRVFEKERSCTGDGFFSGLCMPSRKKPAGLLAPPHGKEDVLLKAAYVHGCLTREAIRAREIAVLRLLGGLQVAKLQNAPWPIAEMLSIYKYTYIHTYIHTYKQPTNQPTKQASKQNKTKQNKPKQTKPNQNKTNKSAKRIHGHSRHQTNAWFQLPKSAPYRHIGAFYPSGSVSDGASAGLPHVTACKK